MNEYHLALPEMQARMAFEAWDVNNAMLGNTEE